MEAVDGSAMDARAEAAAAPRIFGVDFTSAPRPRKPIVAVGGTIAGGMLRLESVERLAGFAAFEQWLLRPGPWVAAFDFPFGLARELLQALGWPHLPAGGRTGWARMVAHLAAMPRAEMVAAFRRWCDARPPGAKFAHRATDLPAGSSPAMKWVNPPVSFMLQAGAPRLLAAGVWVPGLQPGDPRRVALEGYPGVLARAAVGRVSYKSDTAAGRTPAREQARRAIVAALESGRLLAQPVVMDDALREACIADPQGDVLDAALCAVQAAWAQQRRDRHFGLPPDLDPVEGWIVGTSR